MKLSVTALVTTLLVVLCGCSTTLPPSAVETELVRLAENPQSGKADSVSAILGATLVLKDRTRTESGADCKAPGDVRAWLGERYAAAVPEAGRWDTIELQRDWIELCDGTFRHADRLLLRGLRTPGCLSLASLSDRFSSPPPYLPPHGGFPSKMREYELPDLGSSAKAGFEMRGWSDKSDCIRDAYVLAYYRTRQ